MYNDSKKQDAKQLMLQAKHGDTQSFEKLYTIYFVPVFRYLYSRTKDKQTSEDLAQTTFLKIFNSIDKFHDIGVSPKSYFFTVAKNTLTDHWRTHKSALSIDTGGFDNKIPAQDNQQSHMEQKEQNSVLLQNVQKLNDDQKIVIIRKFLEGFSNKEIAEELDKTEEAIRQIQCRALKQLRVYTKNI
jgi:RNA polymerase sigma-70 factor, ECF subfamily